MKSLSLLLNETTKFKEISEPVHVGIPTSLGNKLGLSLYDEFSISEKQGILYVAKTIYETYTLAIDNIENSL